MISSALAAKRLVCANSVSSVREVSAAFAPDTFTLVLGEIGSGKNLFLRALGLLEMPEAGDVFVQGMGTRALDAEARGALRNRHFGFLFAQPFLLPSFSAIENIAMPLFKMAGVTSEQARPRVAELMEFAGLAELDHVAVARLSPLDQHRVALARALVNEPTFLLAESADGALDGDDLAAFAKLLRQAVDERGVTLVATATTPAFIELADRVLEFGNGRIARDSQPVAFGGATA